MRRKVVISGAVAVLALVDALASPSGAAQRREDQILAELRQIQAQLSQLQTSQAALKSAVEELTVQRQADEQLRKTLADSKLSLDRLQEELSILSARVEETNGRLGNLRQEIASMRQTQQPLLIPPTTEGEEPPDEAPAEAGEAPAAATPPVVAAGPNINDIYNQARIDYTQGRYPLAISGFREVLDLEPRGDLADNALYWMGESYLAQRQYERALDEFDRIIREYPDANKLPDAYLKKAMTLEAMDRRSEAMQHYELVIEQFPRSPQERVARRRLEELMRTTRPRP